MTTPAKTPPSFLRFLHEACEGAPPEITAIVEKAITIHNLGELLQYYEVKNPKLAYHIIEAVKLAVDAKMQADVDASCVGNKTFMNLVTHAVAFGIVAGAHLAKERKL